MSDQLSGFVWEGYQPLVDLALNYLVELGMKSEKWAEKDRLSGEWHYAVGWKMVFFETGMPHGYMMLPEDPRWQDVVEEAIDRMVDAGAKTIKPIGNGSELVRQLEIAREDYLGCQEPSPAFLEEERRRERESLKRAAEERVWDVERIEANVKRKQAEGEASRARRKDRHRTVLAINGYSQEEVEDILKERYPESI